MIAAIYARISKKQKTQCPYCAKTVRIADDRLIKHVDRQYRLCAGTAHQVDALDDKGQDADNQLHQLREYCARRQWTVVEEYIDNESAKTGERDAFKRLFSDASKRRFDVVVAWALDRFSREGIYETFDYVRKLTQHGVQFESYTEAHFRTTGPAGDLMLAVAAWVAKQERLRISERTKAGVDRARRQGKICGRPTRVFRRDEAVRMRAEGWSWRAIARKLGVPQSTIRLQLKGSAEGVQQVPCDGD